MTTVSPFTNEQIVSLILEGAANWRAQNTPEAIKEKINQTLDKETQKIILATMGLDTSWGHLRISTGDSPIKDVIKQAATAAAVEFFASCKNKFKVTQKLQKELQAEYEYRYESHVKQLINGLAEKQAKDAANKLMAEISIGATFSKFTEALKLIQDNTNHTTTN